MNDIPERRCVVTNLNVDMPAGLYQYNNESYVGVGKNGEARVMGSDQPLSKEEILMMQLKGGFIMVGSA